MSLPDLAALSQEDERLRWVAADRPAVGRALVQAERELEGTDGPAALRLLAYVGNANRLLGRRAEAIAAHERARDLAEGSRPRAAALIRFGESLRCANRFEEAERVLREALAIAPAELEHFALQHLGKTLLDRGRAAAAADVLEAALALRSTGGDEELVASTERALVAARESAR